MRRSWLVLTAAVVAAIAVFGAASTLGVTSKKIDAFGADQAATTSTVDPPPALTTLEMFDTTGNGKIDQVKATFNEGLASYTAGNAPWTLANVPSGGTLASVSVTSPVATLTITEGAGAPDTAVGSFTVALAANASGIRDVGGHQSSFAATAPADKAAPFATAADYYDANSNGKIDQIKVTYSEALAATSATSPWSITGGPAGLATADLLANTASASGAVITLPFSETNGTATATTTVATTTLTVLLNNAGQDVKDVATLANFAANVSKVTADKANPIPITLTSAGGAALKPEQGDTITVVFSEPLAPASLCPGQTGDFSFTNVNDNIKVIFTNGTSPVPDSYTVTTTDTECTGGGLRFGQIGLGRSDFVSANTQFWGNGSGKRTELTWTGATATLVVKLGQLDSGTATTAGGTSVATYDPHDSLADPSGNTVPSTLTFSTTNTSHF